jgi:membrane fusion protein (multidrug efflux system)
MKSKTKQRIVVVVGLLGIVAALVGVKANQIVTMVRAGESAVPPPLAVTSARVQGAEWAATREAVATIVPVEGVTVASEVSGRVREIAFQSGATVKPGEVMIRLDTSAEEAQLAGAVADARLARATFERARRLRQGEANAQADLDVAQARADQADAAVANLKALIAKKTIRAPFEGRISIREVSLGQILAPGTAIATLQMVNPIHADFWLPQQAIRDITPDQRVRLRTDVFPDGEWDGQVTTVNPQVDTATRNVRIRATVPNVDGRLRPGMFGRVEVLSPTSRPVLTVPATAVLFAPYGDSVYVIEQDQGHGGGKQTVAHQRFIRVGERRGDLVEVLTGLRAGETVVGSGGFRLRNGVAVAVNDALAPKAQLAPKPTDN